MVVPRKIDTTFSVYSPPALATERHLCRIRTSHHGEEPPLFRPFDTLNNPATLVR